MLGQTSNFSFISYFSILKCTQWWRSHCHRQASRCFIPQPELFQVLSQKKWVPVRIQRINWWMMLTQPPHFYPLLLQKQSKLLLKTLQDRKKLKTVLGLSKSQKWLLTEIAPREQKIMGREWDDTILPLEHHTLLLFTEIYRMNQQIAFAL